MNPSTIDIDTDIGIDTPAAVARDLALISRISAVPSLLRVICETTGMGFAAVARVTEGTWTACAVQDDIQFGLKAGGTLPVNTTLCIEARAARMPVVIDHASEDPVYRHHHTPRTYNIESYISVPIVLRNGVYFGNLCAIDPRPSQASAPRTVSMFNLFAELIALQIDNEDRRTEAESALSGERAQSELREQFIAVLGHDLRNPLAAIGATAEVLARKTTDPSVSAMGQRLKSATRRMATLIDDVLDFARGRLGSGLGLALADVLDLELALRDVVAEAEAANAGRVVVQNILIDQPVLCDRGRVQQLLSNLLGNALSYGAPELPVLVNASVRDGALAIEVANGGVPISPADLGKVFEPYWRPPTSKPGGGLGLGLYICQQIVKAHGGLLAVNSSEETGTRFTARIPVR